MAQEPMRHPSGIKQEIVDKVVARRGKLNAFEGLDPVKTAVVVIDLDIETARDTNEQIASMSSTINAVCVAVREGGGVVAWVTTPLQKATENFRAVFGDAFADHHENNERLGSSNIIWPELDQKTQDIQATKQGHSAFFPGKSNLHEQLQKRGIEYLLIAGAVTNVCCEASARDAAELQYKVILVSDALFGWSEEQDQATFASFFRCYGDVRPASHVIALMK